MPTIHPTDPTPPNPNDPDVHAEWRLRVYMPSDQTVVVYACDTLAEAMTRTAGLDDGVRVRIEHRLVGRWSEVPIVPQRDPRQPAADQRH